MVGIASGSCPSSARDAALIASPATAAAEICERNSLRPVVRVLSSSVMVESSY